MKDKPFRSWFQLTPLRVLHHSQKERLHKLVTVYKYSDFQIYALVLSMLRKINVLVSKILSQDA